MNWFASLLLILFSSLSLIWAVQLFVGSATKIARYLKISGFTISFLLVAVATSLPELVVGITSALEGRAALSYGNVVGANISLVTFVAALSVLFGHTVSTRNTLHSKDLYFTTFLAVLPIILGLDGTLSRFEGLGLIFGYLVYASSVLRRSSKLESLLEKFEHTNIWKQLFIFFVSLALLLLASEGIVRAATNLSSQLGFSLVFIGFTLTAMGTTLPETAFTILNAKQKHNQNALGNIIGSLVANSTLVLGTAAAISPIVITSAKPLTNLFIIIFTVIAFALFLAFSITKERLEKKEAAILSLVYIAFLAVQFVVQQYY